MQKAALYFSGTFFGVGAIFHVVRLVTGIEIMVGATVVPAWISALGAPTSALLAAWMIVAARRL